MMMRKCYYAAILLRRMPHHVLMLSLCLSVSLSVCPVSPPRGKTKRPTNTKLGRKGPLVTSTPWTNFKVKGSEVKVTAANEIPFYNSIYGSGLFMFTIDTQIQYIDIY